MKNTRKNCISCSLIACSLKLILLVLPDYVNFESHYFCHISWFIIGVLHHLVHVEVSCKGHFTFLSLITLISFKETLHSIAKRMITQTNYFHSEHAKHWKTINVHNVYYVHNFSECTPAAPAFSYYQKIHYKSFFTRILMPWVGIWSGKYE